MGLTPFLPHPFLKPLSNLSATVSGMTTAMDGRAARGPLSSVWRGGVTRAPVAIQIYRAKVVSARTQLPRSRIGSRASALARHAY